jgi:uncharacterized protein YllA (UPF0747 family)
MPRQRRKLSKTGTYHIMLRGNERKSLFPEEEDYRKFLQIVPLKIEDISKGQNKYYRDDLILNLKKKSNLSIREIAEILSINRGIVSRIKV